MKLFFLVGGVNPKTTLRGRAATFSLKFWRSYYCLTYNKHSFWLFIVTHPSQLAAYSWNALPPTNPTAGVSVLYEGAEGCLLAHRHLCDQAQPWETMAQFKLSWLMAPSCSDCWQIGAARRVWPEWREKRWWQFEKFTSGSDSSKVSWVPPPTVLFRF